MISVSENVFLFQDTCNVYVVRQGREAILIDFGSGDVLDRLASIGVNTVSTILMTHHHRDQGQGLAKAQELGIPIRVPHTERELFDAVDEHWMSRQIKNNYNVRQDRFSLLYSVPVASTLQDYQTCTFQDIAFYVLPTPGHTTGSVTLIARLDGQTVAFCGDLIAMPGKVWSLSATQWTYNGSEGIAASILSLLDLQEHRPSLLLPSHGEPMTEPDDAIDRLVNHLYGLLNVRRSPDRELEMRFQSDRLPELRNRPFEPISPHLLRNRTSISNSYVLLSESGKALLIDYGYDFYVGLPAGVDRASRRPWLYNMKKLKTDYGVHQIDVVIPTHYHDDHVAGFNLLRRIEGTQVWAAENFADILASPDTYDLPCLWYEPIPPDRVISLNQTIRWEEYEITLYEQPGHTLYAVAVSFEADGHKVLAIGDQQGNDPSLWNYVYQNGFRYGDYVKSAELYARLRPDLILSGHWDPLWVTPEYVEQLAEKGKALEQAHRQLLPTQMCDFEAGGFAAKIQPYYSAISDGGKLDFTVEIRNPLADDAEAEILVVAPAGWLTEPGEFRVSLAARSRGQMSFSLDIPKGTKAFRERIAVDVTVGKLRLGQQAEALITVL